MKLYRLHILFFLFFCGIFPCSGVFAQTEKNSFSEVKNSFSELEFTVNLTDLQFIPVENEHGHFFKIWTPNIEYTESKVVGKPTLPLIQRNIEISFGSTPTVEITISDSVVYSLKKLNIEGQLIPAQVSVFKNRAAAAFSKNEATYSSDAFFDFPLAEVNSLGILRNMQLGRLTLSPISYNPVKQELKVYTQFQVRIFFANADEEKTSLEKAKHSSIFETGNSLKTLNLINPKNLIRKETQANYPVKYVIVAPDSFQTALKEFIGWKREKGFQVIEIYTGKDVSNNTESIKEMLAKFYSEATPANPAPAYLALIGDMPLIPSFYVPAGTYHPDLNAHYTDLFYAEYTGDTYPDLFYGRIPARNITQLNGVLRKIIDYEKYNFPEGDSFLSNTLLIAGNANEGNAFKLTNGQLDYLKNIYLDNSNTTVYYNGVSGSKTNEIIDKLSVGGSLINYTSHCLNSGWRNPNISTTNAKTLNNTNKYFFSINNCCLSSQFNEIECFGEALVNNPTGGAIGVIGAANETLWEEDFYWSVGAYNLPETPVYLENSLGAFDRFFHTHSEKSNEWRASLGEILQGGNLAVTQSGSYFEKFYWEIYNILGDPSLMPYAGIPENLTISFPDSLSAGTLNIPISGSPWAYVAASANGELLGTCLLNENGTGALTLSKALDSGSLKMVATKQFSKPFFKNISLFSPNGSRLALWDSDFLNAQQQKTDSIFPNQNYTLRLEVKNVGKSKCFSQKISVTSPSGNLEISPASHIFDSVASNEIKTYTFNILSKFGLSNLAIENLVISINDLPEKELTLLALAPKIKITNAEIINACLENGNYNLNFSATNSGNVDFVNASVEISAFESNGTVLASETLALGRLNVSEEKKLPFSFDCSLLPQDNLLNICIKTSSEGFNQTDTFYLQMKRSTEDFESGNFAKHAWIQNDNSWVIETNRSKVFQGNYAVRSSNTRNLSVSTLAIKIHVIEADSLSFHYKVSSEAGYDGLSFHIDKTLKNKWSGIINWSECKHLLTVGEHLLEWKYTKDEETSENEDAAWVDNIVFPPYGKNLIITSPLFQTETTECNLYPNPAKDFLNIKLNSSEEVVSVNIFNLLGKKMPGNWKLNGEKNSYFIDTHLYPEGIYFLILQTRNNVIQKKFMVIR